MLQARTLFTRRAQSIMARTMTTAPSDHRVVQTTLNYYLDPSKGGHTELVPGTAEYHRRKFDVRPVCIHNIRGCEDQFSLETHGFQHYEHTSAEKDFTSDERIKQVVYPETVQLLKDITGATRIQIYSHITRRDSVEQAKSDITNDPTLQARDAPYTKITPARFVHIDFSESGSLTMFNENVPPDLAPSLSQTRWSLINVWRPIKPISKDPLAVCDARTVHDADMMPVFARRPVSKDGSGSQYANLSKGNETETYYKRYHPDEAWYYADRMAPHEVLVMKMFDTLRDGKSARRCFHSSFVDPDTRLDDTRESIEVRALVFFEDQPV